MLAVYAIVNGNEPAGRRRRRSGCSAPRRAARRLPRDRVARRAPLVPLGSSSSATSRRERVGVLWAAAMFAWFFLSALYLQLVLGYSPLEVGLAFLPANLIMGAFSLGLSAKLVMRFGIKRRSRRAVLAALGCCSSRARRSTAATSSTCCRA
jgi:hypothetical protein